jgi:hypothetical protein
LNETLVEFNSEQLEQQMEASAALILQEMHCTTDLHRRINLFEQAADQEASLISEVLDGAVITNFRFHSVDGRLQLLQPDGVTDWQEMHEHGVLRAKARAAEDENYEPYVRMAVAELAEASSQEKISTGGEPAVMVKLSLCGNDVMADEQLDKLGRNPEVQRAFLRVSVFDGNDMHIHSHSIDGLSLNDGRGIATGWGLWEEPQMILQPDASSVDILENQIYFDQSQMSVQEMHQLANRLVESFDTLQTKRTGIPYKDGRVHEGVNTYEFVLDNRDLLDAHMSSMVELAARTELPISHLAALTSDLRYDIMSSFKQRLEGTWIEYGSIGESVVRAGEIERTLGTQYGGCDMVISAAVAEQAGYVNAQGASRIERAMMIKKLRKEAVGSGDCSACGAKSKLYGCGLCGECNKKWCDIFEETGRQTSISKLSRYKRKSHKRSKETETLGEYWKRLGREAELQ